MTYDLEWRSYDEPRAQRTDHGLCGASPDDGGCAAEDDCRQTVGNQIARSGTSVAANYRAALRAKSDADFINKITIVLEEADESGFWIELAERAKLLPSKRLKVLLQEAEELTKIFNATRATTKRRTARNHKS